MSRCRSPKTPAECWGTRYIAWWQCNPPSAPDAEFIVNARHDLGFIAPPEWPGAQAVLYR